MESLKRKLSTTRRPETAGRSLLPELNQYKQNNVALQYVSLAVTAARPCPEAPKSMI